MSEVVVSNLFYFFFSQQAVFDHLIIAEGSHTGAGAALWVQDGVQLTLSHSYITHTQNAAPYGALYCNGSSSISLIGTSVYGNDGDRNFGDIGCRCV